jgi:hypothetical protein
MAQSFFVIIREWYSQSMEHLYNGRSSRIFGCEAGMGALVALVLPSGSQSGTLTHYSMKEGLQGMFITSIMEDRNGHLWFGSENAVSDQIRTSTKE